MMHAHLVIIAVLALGQIATITAVNAQNTPSASAPADSFFSSSITLNGNPALAETIYTNEKGIFRVIGAPLVDVISKAYQLPRYQIVDGPAWIHTPYLYDIEAVPPPSFIISSEDKMLKALLADRFSLQVHTAQRPVSTLVLGLADKTPNFASTPDGGEGGYRMANELMGGRRDFLSVNFTFDEFAAFLTARTGQPVINKTGLTERYRLQFDGYNDRDPEASIRPLLELQGITLEQRTTVHNVLVVGKIAHPRLDE